MIFDQKEVVAQVQDDGQLIFRKIEKLGKRWYGHSHFGKADFKDDGKGKHQEQQQPEERDTDDGHSTGRQEPFPLFFYHVNTTAAPGCQLR